MALHETIDDGVATIVMDNPPVNALGIADTYALADLLDGYRRRDDVRAVVLTAEGRGFCAGVDIGEIQAMDGHDGLVEANRSCFEAFRAVYECAAPVVVAVNGFCLGSGIGLAGNADVVVAVEGAGFGLPEVDNGALGAATHLMRLVPAHRARWMLYSCEPATAEELHAYGSVLRVVPEDDLRDVAMELAGVIAAKDPMVVGSQGLPERDRPGGRPSQLPVRTGLHLRAEPARRRRRCTRGVPARRPGPQGRGRLSRLKRV